MALFAASASFLYWQYQRMAMPSPSAVAPAPPPPKAAPVLGPSDLSRFRDSAHDNDPRVRWASLELLYALGDPSSVPLLEKAATGDPDPDLKLKALKLLETGAGKPTVQGLVKGLQDPDKEVRLETLRALGKLGDPAAAPWITDAASKDYEPEVKIEAMHVLGAFQDEQRAKFNALAARLREQYEAAVARAKREHQEDLEPPKLGEAPDLPSAPK